MGERITGYKVIRQDGTDCFIGRLRYTVGETVTEPEADRYSRKDCGPGLHLCHRPEDTLRFRNSQWPVRLLRVSSDDVIASGPTKARCGSLRVEEEIGLSSAFGVNGDAVVSLLNDLAGISWLKPPAPVTVEVLQPLVDEHLSRLTQFSASVGPLPVRIVHSWGAAKAAARGAAGDAAGDAAWTAAWDAAVAAAGAAAGYATRAAAWDAAWDAARAAARDVAWAAAGAAARDVAWDAQHRVVADLVDWPSPWEPLVAIWRMGCWPVGVVGGEFVVFVPEAPQS